MEIMPEVIVLTIFLLILYRGFCWKPKIKIEKAPTTKQIRRERRRKRLIKKIKRMFKLPRFNYETEIIKYDKKTPYIEAAWEEVEKPKRPKNKH